MIDNTLIISKIKSKYSGIMEIFDQHVSNAVDKDQNHKPYKCLHIEKKRSRHPISGHSNLLFLNPFAILIAYQNS